MVLSNFFLPATITLYYSFLSQGSKTNYYTSSSDPCLGKYSLWGNQDNSLSVNEGELLTHSQNNHSTSSQGGTGSSFGNL